MQIIYSVSVGVVVGMDLGNKSHFTHETGARDHHTTSTLIRGKGGASPSSLHTKGLSGQRNMEMQDDGC